MATKKKHTSYAKSDGHKLIHEKPFNWDNLPRKLKIDKRYKITIEEYTPMKSQSQMGYYRGGIIPFITKELEDETGATQDQWHEELKIKVGKRTKDKTGKIDIIVSLADYTEADMRYYIEQVKIHMRVEWGGFEIPPPTAIGDYID